MLTVSAPIAIVQIIFIFPHADRLAIRLSHNALRSKSYIDASEIQCNFPTPKDRKRNPGKTLSLNSTTLHSELCSCCDNVRNSYAVLNGHLLRWFKETRL